MRAAAFSTKEGIEQICEALKTEAEEILQAIPGRSVIGGTKSSRYELPSSEEILARIRSEQPDAKD